MAKTVFTGWRNVTPGPCPDCGFDEFYECDGRGNVFCTCQCCPDCLEFDGHNANCPAVRENRTDNR